MTWYGKTLWNFAGAGSVNYGAGGKGAILAPDATVTSAGDLDGSLAAYNATRSGEVHLPMWSGASSVPEPSTSAAAGSVAILVGMTILPRRQIPPVVR